MPSIVFWLPPLACIGWGAGDNKISMLRSSINPIGRGLDGGAGDNKKSLLRSSITPWI